MERGRRFLWLTVIVLFCLAPACSPGRLMEAARVLADIDAGPLPSDLKRQTPRPSRLTVSFSVDGRWRLGDLYSPGDETRAGMVLVPGVTPLGKDDPRLVAFAETFARARFRVLVPDLPRLRRLEVSAADARVLADACLHLDDLLGGGRPLGLTAVSYAVGPAVAALFEPDMQGRVDFVVAIGGYFDIEAVVTFVTTGYYRERADGPWRHRRPNTYGKWVFAISNADRLGDAADRRLLRTMAERRLADPAAAIGDLVDGLGAEGRAVHALLVNKDPDRVPALLADLPAGVVAEMAALDLERRDLEGLDARFVLVHGNDDPVIPETESVGLAAALAPGRAELYLVDSLDHVDPQPMGIIDRLTLLGAIHRVLVFRDRHSVE